MLKKAKVLLASCILFAGASTVQAAQINFNALTELAGAGGGTIHPAEATTWYGGGLSGMQFVNDMGVAGKTITVGLSTNHLIGSGDVSLSVWGTNDSVAMAQAGTATWTEATFASFELITNPLDGDDLATYWNFGGVDSFSVIGVGSAGTMGLTTTAVWGGAGAHPGAAGLVEFDTITVPAPAAALLMIPGLVGIVTFGRKKGLKAA